MKLYKEYASWWHLLSPIEEYKEESAIFLKIIEKYAGIGGSCLELGSGGGNNAYYLKKYFDMTLVDLSVEMLRESHKINPECNHVRGDMRSLALKKRFELVFIHDAISHITTIEDLEKVIKTAHQHIKQQGMLLIMPDEYEDTFSPQTDCGGSDQGKRGIRYMEWSYDPIPGDQLITVQYAYIFRDEDGTIHHGSDHAQNGLFSMEVWRRVLEGIGFEVYFEKVEFSDQPDRDYFAIIGKHKNQK